MLFLSFFLVPYSSFLSILPFLHSLSLRLPPCSSALHECVNTYETAAFRGSACCRSAISRVLADAEERSSSPPSPPPLLSYTRSRVFVVIAVALLSFILLLSSASQFYKTSDGIQLEVRGDLARARVRTFVGATASVRVLLLLLLLLVLVCRRTRRPPDDSWTGWMCR